MLWMKVVFHPRYLLHLLILLLLVFFPDYLSQKEMETLHSSIDSGSSLTVAETTCKNPSILKSVQNIIENGIEEKCKKLCSKTNGSILGYTNYQTMSQFSIDKPWDEFVSELPFLVKTLKVICKDYTDERVKLCFIYSILLNGRWSHLSLFQIINSALMIESGSSKKVGLYVCFSNSFLKNLHPPFPWRNKSIKINVCKINIWAKGFL